MNTKRLDAFSALTLSYLALLCLGSLKWLISSNALETWQLFLALINWLSDSVYCMRFTVDGSSSTYHINVSYCSDE